MRDIAYRVNAILKRQGEEFGNYAKLHAKLNGMEITTQTSDDRLELSPEQEAKIYSELNSSIERKKEEMAHRRG